MAKTNCEVNQDNIETIIATNDSTDRIIDNTQYLANPDFDLLEIILKNKKKEYGEVLTDDELNDAFKDLYEQKYGKGSSDILAGQISLQSLTLAGKINALLQANPHLVDVFLPFIQRRIPEGRRISTGDGKIHLAAFPVPRLKVIYAQIHGMVNQYSGGKPAHGNFKGFVANLTTPGQMIYKDPSGALSIIQKATRDYPDFVASRINTFMNQPENLPDDIKEMVYAILIGKDVKDLTAADKRKARKYFEPEEGKIIGMQDILSEIDHLGRSQDLGYSNGADRLVNLFSMLMRGEVSLEYFEGGELMIYSTYGTLYDDKGDIRRHPIKDGELEGAPMKGFKNITPLKEYIPPNGKRGDFYVELTDGSGNTKNMWKEISNLVKKARIIDNAVFFYAQKEMKGSLEKLYSEMKVAMGLDESELNILLFKKGSVVHNNYIKHLKNNNPEAYKLYELYDDTFGMLVSQENIIANGGAYDLEAPTHRENHWPTLYDKENLKLMLDQLKSELEGQIDKLEKKGVIRKSLRNLYINGTEDEWALYNADGQLTSTDTIRNNMDDYHVDLQHNTIIPFAADNKHFKRISTAYDIRNGRRDDGVYYDYLKNIMSTIQRNYMAADLVKALSLIKKSKRIPEGDEKNGLINYTTNLFKVPFHAATVKGMFDISNESMSKRITGLFGNYFRRYTPQAVTSMFKVTASKLTSVMLPGFMTPLTNLSGIFQNVNEFGRKVLMNAIWLYFSKTKGVREGIKKLVERSGIAEFSDFFSRAMVNGILKIQVEQDVHWYLLREMTRYHDNVKIMGEEKARDAFNKAAVKILSNSNSYLKAEEISILNSNRIDIRKEQLQLDKRTAQANKLVQFAIEKEFEFKKLLKVPGIKNLLYRKVSGGAQGVAGLYVTFLKLTGKAGLTMSNTEKFVRTISFIIGIQRAYDAGLLNRKEDWWNYSSLADRDKAIQIGREFSYFANFGMSTQAVGKYNYNGIGNLSGKFKYWSQQKFGRDVRMFKEAYTSLKSEKKIDAREFDPAAIAKLILKIIRPGFSLLGGKVTGITPYQERLRKEHPEVAALRTFMTTQVLMTMLWDTILGGPLRLAKYIPGVAGPAQFVRSWLYKSGGAHPVRNLTSDLASLVMLIPLIFVRSGLMSLTGLDDEDEEYATWDRVFTYYMRKVPFLGYLPTMGFDRILAYIFASSEEAENQGQRLIHSHKSRVGGQWPGASIHQEFLERRLDLLMEPTY